MRALGLGKPPGSAASQADSAGSWPRGALAAEPTGPDGGADERHTQMPWGTNGSSSRIGMNGGTGDTAGEAPTWGRYIRTLQASAGFCGCAKRGATWFARVSHLVTTS